ncbi:MAG: hypothetical protein JWN46_3786, partial [Acidimicrobiales bacterium]|nr:hypothetical protein [Acidimicrobiales bacterium]
LHSHAAHPKPDPVVQLEGGPGYPSLVDVARYANSRLLGERDYIIWDQRGLGFSQPNLDCPETNEAIWGIFATADPAPVEGRRIEASLAACRARLLAAGVDLDGYDTVQNAADLADLRVALGIKEWNLRGVSYGSALAIETVRSHPQGLHSVLLDSVVAPDGPYGSVDRAKSALRAFDELYRACAAQPTCAAKYGDLHALALRAAKALDTTPYRTTIRDPETGKVRPVAITGQDLWAGLFNAMYDNTLIPAMPGAIKAIADGNRSIIDALASNGIPFAAGSAEAMTASVDCADRARLLDTKGFVPFAAAHPELGPLMYLSAPETGCSRWGVHEAAPPFNQLLGRDTKVPIIVMAGRFDPVTPPAGTRRVADALGLALLQFPDVGHGAVSSDDCARTIWFAFMDAPSARPDTSCIARVKPLTFG